MVVTSFCRVKGEFCGEAPEYVDYVDVFAC